VQDLTEKNRTAVAVIGDSYHLAINVLRHIWHNAAAGALVVIDEADLFIPTAEPNQEILSLLKRGRRRNISVGILSQYPTSIHKIARNLINIQIIGNATGRAFQRFAKDTFNIDPVEIPPYSFTMFNPYNKTARMMDIPKS